MQAGSMHRVQGQAMRLKQNLAQRAVGKRYEEDALNDHYALPAATRYF